MSEPTAIFSAPPPALPPGTASLFLDFDGTLVPLAPRHDAVVVAPAVPALVRRLAQGLAGRLAVVSGRPADEIDAYLHDAEGEPPFAIAGSHGLELRWSDGRREQPPPPAGLAEAIAAFEHFAQDHPGVVVEPKPYGAALHFRQAPEAGAASDALAEALAERTGMGVQRGKMVCELRGAGSDKGDAVRRLLDEASMAGSVPIFVGDDLTDEAGFRAAQERGGWGIKIGPGDSIARYRLADVEAVLAWLGGVADTMGVRA